VDFLIGTFVLAWIALVVGEITVSLVFLAVRRRIDETTREVTRFHNLSMDALAEGDKRAYQAANKLANDAFGKSFFMQIALSAAFLWPIFFTLVWMDYRFSDVEFNLAFTDYFVGYPGIFVALYAAAYLIFKRIKYKLPYFRGIKTILDTYDDRTTRMKSAADLMTAERPIRK
jgi:hypothetical protein